MRTSRLERDSGHCRRDRRILLDELRRLAAAAGAGFVIETSAAFDPRARDERRLDLRVDGPRPPTPGSISRMLAGLIDHPAITVVDISRVGPSARVLAIAEGAAGRWQLTVTLAIAP